MKMIQQLKRTALVGCCITAMVTLCACTASVTLYPVSGPYSQASPVPTFQGKISGTNKSGTFRLTMAGDEVVTGPYATIDTPPAPSDTSSGNPAAAMPNAWNVVYGAGYYNAHVVGSRLFVDANLTGTNGTTMHLQFYVPQYTVPTNGVNARVSDPGVAVDNHGNILKVSIHA